MNALFQKSCAPPRRGKLNSRLFFKFLCLQFQIFFPSFILFLYVLISHFSHNFRQILKNIVPLCPISLLFLEFQSICFGMLFLYALFSYFFLEFQVIFLLKFGSLCLISLLVFGIPGKHWSKFSFLYEGGAQLFWNSPITLLVTCLTAHNWQK